MGTSQGTVYSDAINAGVSVGVTPHDWDFIVTTARAVISDADFGDIIFIKSARE